MQECTASLPFEVDEIRRGRQEQESGLKSETLDRAERRGLLNQSVKAKSERKRQGDPWERAIAHREIQHACCRKSDGDPLPDSKLFTKHKYSQQHADQGIDEIAETGFHDKPGVDRPDIHGPVETDKYRSQSIDPENTAIPGGCPKCTPLAEERRQSQQQDAGPYDAMSDQLEGGNGTQPFPIDGEQTPGEIRADGMPDPLPHCGASISILLK